jgi:threonine/homoserine/homoserine lactone efflux protein
MGLVDLALFATIYATAVATPGPGVAANVARALGCGTRGLPQWIAGFVVGDLIWFWGAALGLSALAQTSAHVVIALKWAGIAYLLWIAWKLWTAPIAASEVEAVSSAADESVWHAFAASLALTLGNPKVIVFFMAILPTVVDLAALSLADVAAISVIIVGVMVFLVGGYALAAVRARRLFATPSALRVLNRTTGTVMAGAALAIAKS